MHEQTKTSNRWWMGVGVLATLLALYYFVRFIIANTAELPEIEVTGAELASLGFALAVYVVVLTMGGLVWHLLMKGVGENVHPLDTFSVFFVSQFAKYIPGNVAHHIGRVVLARRRGMASSKVLLTMAIEVGWAISAGVSLAMITLLGGGLASSGSFKLPTTQELILFGLLALFVPLIGTYILSNPKLSIFRRFLGRVEINSPGWSVLFLTFILYLLNFLSTGGIIQILARQVFHVEQGSVFMIAGIFAIAWVAGFLTPGAPAGLGVREAILVSLLSPVMGAGEAIGVTVVLRLVTSFGEAIVFGIGLSMGRISGRDLLQTAPEMNGHQG